MTGDIFEAFVAVRNGRLEDFDRRSLQFALRAYSGPAELIVRRPRRNSVHNRLLHATCGNIAAELGWDADEFKEFIVTKLRPLEQDPVTGWVRRQKTRDMSDQQIRELVTEIDAWAVMNVSGYEPRSAA